MGGPWRDNAEFPYYIEPARHRMACRPTTYALHLNMTFYNGTTQHTNCESALNCVRFKKNIKYTFVFMFCRDMSIFCLEVFVIYVHICSGFSRTEVGNVFRCVELRQVTSTTFLVNSCGFSFYIIPIQMEMAGDGVDKEIHRNERPTTLAFKC